MEDVKVEGIEDSEVAIRNPEALQTLQAIYFNQLW